MAFYNDYYDNCQFIDNYLQVVLYCSSLKYDCNILEKVQPGFTKMSVIILLAVKEFKRIYLS